METLKLKFAVSSSSEALTIAEYEVDPALKERFIGEKGQIIRDVEMSYIQYSFKINYA